jgi:hypothetical protein
LTGGAVAADAAVNAKADAEKALLVFETTAERAQV